MWFTNSIVDNPGETSRFAKQANILTRFDLRFSRKFIFL